MKFMVVSIDWYVRDNTVVACARWKATLNQSYVVSY